MAQPKIKGIGPKKRKRIAKRESRDEKFNIAARRREQRYNVGARQREASYAITDLAQELGSATKAFRKEVSSQKGATRMAQRATRVDPGAAAALAGTPEGAQLAQEVQGRKSDLKRGLPGLIASTQREYKTTRAGISQDIADERFRAAEDIRAERFKAREDIAAEKSHARGDIQSALKTIIKHQKTEAASGSSKESHQAEKRQKVRGALNEGLRLIEEQKLVNADPKTKPEDKGHPIPQTDLEWLRFENKLRTVEGVDSRSARKAVKQMRRNIERALRGASAEDKARAAAGQYGPFQNRRK